MPSLSQVLNAVHETLMDSVADNKRVQFIGFGTFEPRERKARTGRNPKTGEEIQIKASRAPAFSPSKKFKDMVNEKM